MEKKYLGVMLDCSRNAVMTVGEVKKFVDILADLGYNMLQLYLEDTYEIPDEPLFGYMRGRYTQAELKEIDAYCLAKGIECVPCMQTLAHLKTIFDHPPFWEAKDTDGILLIGEERTYELIEHMFASLRECFSSDKIHIGMDEAWFVGRGKYLDKHGYVERTELMLQHLEKVCELCEKYHFKPQMWSDMLLSGTGSYYKKGNRAEEKVIARVPKNIDLVYWDYYSEEQEIYEDIIKQHKEISRPIWFAGGAWKWWSFGVSNTASIRRTKFALDACSAQGVENVIITLWGGGGGGDEASVYCVLPTLFYVSQYYEGITDLEEIKNNFKVRFGEEFDDFMLLDLNLGEDIPRAQALMTGCRSYFYCDPFLGRLDSTVFDDGREGKAWATLAKKMKNATKRSKNFAYIFETYAKLCDVLALKHNLGCRTRKAYLENDTVALKEIAADFKILEKRVARFAEIFQKMWFYEKKPQGFEVQDVRLGGLMQRLKNCRKRLELFLEGKVNNIPELEEKVVDYINGSDNFTKHILDYNNYIYSITTNVF